MKRKVFTGLVLLMGISIIGIIAVQLVWMNNAIRVQKELFSRGVNEALHQTVTRLENIHNLSVVNQITFNDSVHWIHESDGEILIEHAPWPVAPDIKSSGNITGKAPRPVKIIREKGPVDGSAVIEIEVDTDTNSGRTSKSFSYRMRSGSRANGERVIEKGTIEDNNIVEVHIDTLLTTTDSLYRTGLIRIDSMLMKLDTLSLKETEITERARVKAVQLKSVANRVKNEIIAWDIRELDEELLGKVLDEELKNNQIPIDFEYGIVRDSVMTFPEAITDSALVANSEFQVNLYPNDILQKNLKLAVFFPDQSGFIYKSLNWLLVVSFLFSLIILLTFALSIFYILRQKKISEMKSDFINNMTHEFKTPIATISVATDSITNDKVLNDPERIRYFTGMIKKENLRMNRQVEDILTIARLDKKDFEFTWEAVDVHDLIRDAVQGIILQIEQRGGKLEQSLKALNPVVATDRMHCTNVIYNLIDNANKYSPEAPEISVSTTNNSGGVLILVEDKGVGMTRAVQGKIFERFYRQTTGNIHNVKGFGLGLSYVKAVLEANQGTITVQSEPEKGSRFEVFIPFTRS